MRRTVEFASRLRHDPSRPKPWYLDNADDLAPLMRAVGKGPVRVTIEPVATKKRRAK